MGNSLRATLKPFVSPGLARWRSLWGMVRWHRQGFPVPAPFPVKRSVLLRDVPSAATWIETGSYLGQMTEELRRTGSRVFTIEPGVELHQGIKRRFRKFPNVVPLEGTSEDVIPGLLPGIEGSVCFWLDGHYSSGITFRGSSDTPILAELKEISKNLPRWANVRVFVDDVRCFNPTLPGLEGYPPLTALVQWAEDHHLDWSIEHDILIMKTRSDLS